jgi:hypothetical protein
MKLWIDDARQEPPDWRRARDARQAQAYLSAYPIEEVSLDHDMGRGMNGLDLVRWMIDRKLVPGRVTIHSINPVGAARMATELADAGYDFTLRPFQPPQRLLPPPSPGPPPVRS